MLSTMKSTLLALIIIAIFPGGKLQFWEDVSFQQGLQNYLFPKDPGIVRVRRMDQVEEMSPVPIVLDFIGMVEQYEYPAEEHNITTKDGYHLVLHRIPGSPLWKHKGQKKIVFMQHGIFASSDSWVMFGTGRDLAFLLADQGYDVWIGNVRGNSYCRSHINMTTDDREFWKFSFHEMGTVDIPAQIDYILNLTGQESLYYIGHSMGTTILFTLLSMKPEYNAKIKLAICFAPVALWSEIAPTFGRIISMAPAISDFVDKYKIDNIAPQSSTTVSITRTFCNERAITQALCIAAIFALVGSDPQQLNTTTLPYILSHIPSGCSVQNLKHYSQNVRSNEFQSFDYGASENYKRYKQKTPLKYDFKKITAPIALFYGRNDGVVRKLNVMDLSKRLPNVVLAEEISFPFFNHLDFIIAIDAKTLLYERILEVLRKFDAKLDLN